MSKIAFVLYGSGNLGEVYMTERATSLLVLMACILHLRARIVA